MSFFDIFQLIASNVWVYGGTFILVLSILVFVHEWGHYIVARMCGVKVETFSIGFGRELWGFNDKNGTRWKISMVPLGGYVKMFGDTDPASAHHKATTEDSQGHQRPMTAQERDVAFFAKPVSKRALIVFAGPAINFLFAIIILAGLYGFYGQPVTPPLAAAVMEGSAADKAGFLPHDKVLSIDGQRVSRFEEVRLKVAVALDTPMQFVVLRDGKEVPIKAVPELETQEDHFGFEHSRGMLGIIGPGSALALQNIKAVNGRPVASADEARKVIASQLGKSMTISLDRGPEVDVLKVKPLKDLNADLRKPETLGLIVASQIGEDFIRRGLFGGIYHATKETWEITASTLTALGQMIVGTRSATELGGIIRIGAIAGDMAQAGFIALISFTALLSINLGLINLFPIPMLDGGHLVFYAVEAVKGSPIPDQMQEYAFRLGLALLVGIMIFANLNDIVQIIL